MLLHQRLRSVVRIKSVLKCEVLIYLLPCGIIIPMTCTHSSDCAVHNSPAYPAGECTCGIKFAQIFVPCGCLPEHIQDVDRKSADPHREALQSH